MRLIIDVPDAELPAALELAMKEAGDDYARRYDKPGWGWVFYHARQRFWVRGIKGGLSISLAKSAAPQPPDEPTASHRSREHVKSPPISGGGGET